MKRKNYIFTNLKHSKRAIMSVILGTISLVSLGIVLYLSYIREGDIPIEYGLTGFLAAVFSMIGLILGMLTVQSKETFKLFPVLGTLLNLAVLGILAFLMRMTF